MKGFTINSLKAKLKKHGVVVNKESMAAAKATPPAYFDLNNLFDVSRFDNSDFTPPCHLSVTTPNIDAAMGEGEALASTRHRKVHVSGGCSAPQEHACPMLHMPTALHDPQLAHGS